MRPGFTCTAEITTATRQQVASVPIQAMAVRELISTTRGRSSASPHAAGAQLQLGRAAATADGARRRGRANCRAGPARARKSRACSSCATARAEFVPVKTGIAGDRYFEVLVGLKEGDQVITGPFNSVRNLKEGDEVKLEQKKDDKK